MNKLEMIIYAFDDLPTSTILHHILNENLINESFLYQFELSNDKFIEGMSTILHLSVFSHRLDLTRELVANGAHVVPIYVENEPVMNVLDLYLDSLPMLDSDYDCESDIRFLASIIDVNELTRTLYESQLSNYHISSILFDFGANPNDFRSIELIKNDENLFRLFLNNGFDINYRNKDGQTFLHLCVENDRDEETIGWLLENGADRSLQDKNNQTAYDCLINKLKNYDQYDYEDDLRLNMLMI